MVDCSAKFDLDLKFLKDLSRNKKAASIDVKYWGGSDLPWRNGTTDDPIIDPEFISRETEIMAKILAEDVASCEDSDSRRNRGISVEFLLHLTFELNLWDWATWEVVQFLVKPATEFSRCRFADLPVVRPYTGPSTVFMSHCWSGLWGDLVVAACSGLWIVIAIFARKSFQSFQIMIRCKAGPLCLD